jgi:hypothetical protein
MEPVFGDFCSVFRRPIRFRGRAFLARRDRGSMPRAMGGEPLCSAAGLSVSSRRLPGITHDDELAHGGRWALPYGRLFSDLYRGSFGIHWAVPGSRLLRADRPAMLQSGSPPVCMAFSSVGNASAAAYITAIGIGARILPPGPGGSSRIDPCLHFPGIASLHLGRRGIATPVPTPSRRFPVLR